MTVSSNSSERAKGRKWGIGVLVVFIIFGVVVWQLSKDGSTPSEATSMSSTMSTTPETAITTTTAQEEEVDIANSTIVVDPSQPRDELIALSGSFQAESPPPIPSPDSITALPEIRANTALVTLRSSRLINESGSREELTVTYGVDYLGTIIDDEESPVQFTFDPETYREWVYLPAARIKIIPRPEASFEWDGQALSYPLQVVEVLSDGVRSQPVVLPNDAAVAFKADGSYYFSQPMQKLLFSAAASSKECVSVARNIMRSRFMEAVRSSYEEIGFARELINEVPVVENIMVPDFSNEGITTEMLTLGGGIWDEFELVSVTCGAE